MSERLLLVILSLGFVVGVGCEYRERVGRTGVPARDARTGIAGPDACVGSGCQVVDDCSNFQAPEGDCTLGYKQCTFKKDCPDLNTNCNGETNRCFLDTDRCVGTPCFTNDDCPSNENCNQTTRTCFERNANQRCMPCFLSSSDCGPQLCNNELRTCM